MHLQATVGGRNIPGMANLADIPGAPVVAVHDVNVAARLVQRRLVARLVRRDPASDPAPTIRDYDFRRRMWRAGRRLVQRRARNAIA